MKDNDIIVQNGTSRQVRTVTPIILQVLMHHFVSPAPYENKSEAARHAHRVLSEQGLIEEDRPNHQEDFRPNASGWRITRKGKYYIEYILCTPFPQTIFVIPERRWKTDPMVHKEG